MVKSAKKNNNVYCAKIAIKTIPYYISTFISVNCPSSADLNSHVNAFFFMPTMNIALSLPLCLRH